MATLVFILFPQNALCNVQRVMYKVQCAMWKVQSPMCNGNNNFCFHLIPTTRRGSQLAVTQSLFLSTFNRPPSHQRPTDVTLTNNNNKKYFLCNVISSMKSKSLSKVKSYKVYKVLSGANSYPKLNCKSSRRRSPNLLCLNKTNFYKSPVFNMRTL